MGSGNSRKPMNASLAGCGGISHWTMSFIRPDGDFRVAAIQDVDENILSAFGNRYGISRRHTGFEDLMEEEVDFVIINSPNDVHLEQVELAAAAGRHCLLQKPITKDLAEALRMEEIVNKAGIKAGMALNEMSDPLNHQLREMIKSGFIGVPVLAQACHAHDYYLETPPEASNWRRDPSRVGGGAFIQLAVHHTNLISWLLGSTVVEASAMGEKGHTVFEDETTSAGMRFACGVLATFSASYATTGKYWTVQGTKGYIHKFNDTLVVKGGASFEGELFDYSVEDEEKIISLDSLDDKSRSLLGKYEIHNRFARWIGGRDSFPCPLEMGVADMKVMDASYRSLASGKTVRVESEMDEG